MSSDPAADTLIGKLKSKFKANKPETTKEHLLKELSNLKQKGEISESEWLMFENVLHFRGRVAHEVMVPRTDAFMVDEKVSFQDNLDEILREPYSRIPVYRGDRDKIVGVIHIRTILRKARKKGFAKLDYQDVMSDPLFAPETTDLSDLLIEMQRTQQQIAILVDEYGGVVGLASIEDLLEEIVGDIDDEVDQAEVLVTKIGDREYVISGKMPLDDFNEEFSVNLQTENVDTVAGYVITKLGVIPAKGEKMSVKLDNGMVLTTRRMLRSRLLTVLLTIPEKLKEKEIDN